jgi:hypothetical protein
MQTLESATSTQVARRVIVDDFVKTLIEADIPLEKADSLLPFLKRWCRDGGSIPTCSVLRRLYISPLYESHFEELKSLFASKRISIMVDETTDRCARHVCNLLFKYRTNLKLVAVEFLPVVDNVTIAQMVVEAVNRLYYYYCCHRYFL